MALAFQLRIVDMEIPTGDPARAVIQDEFHVKFLISDEDHKSIETVKKKIAEIAEIERQNDGIELTLQELGNTMYLHICTVKELLSVLGEEDTRISNTFP